MISQISNHLTDDQFAECALETPGVEAQAHLDTCAHCREELSVFQASMGDFSAAAMGWSQAQPAVSLRAVAATPKRQPVSAYAGLALATGLLVATGTSLLRHQGKAAGDSVSLTPDDTEAQIAQDNQLMQTVNTAIGVTDPSPVREYQLRDVRDPRSAHRLETRSE